MGTLQNANGSYVAIVAGAEDEDFIRHRVGNKHFSMLDIQRNVCWPVQSCQRALDNAQGWSVPSCLQRIHGDRRGPKFPRAGNKIPPPIRIRRPFHGRRTGLHVPSPSHIVGVAARRALIGHIEQLILRVQGNPMHLGQLSLVPFQDAERGIVFPRRFGEDHYRGRIFNGYEKLFGFFIHHHAESAMRGGQFAVGGYVSTRLTGPYGHVIRGVAVHRIDVPGERVHIQTTVLRDFGMRPSDNPLGLRQGRLGRGIVQPAIHHNLIPVFVLENNFIPGHIDGHRAER